LPVLHIHIGDLVINRQRRMVFVGLILLGAAGTVAFALQAFEENMMYFISPSELLAESNSHGKSFRLGGKVKQGSVQRADGNLRVNFTVTDFRQDIPVTYDKILPDLFRERQVAIVRGRFSGGVFRAEEVLASHDERYMPPEVAAKLAKEHGGLMPSADR
jgi:cytochrome c-type biogenesis protein CcmE